MKKPLIVMFMKVDYQVLTFKENDEKYNYVNDIYNTLIKRDICNKYKIKKEHLLDMINDFLMDNISNLTSVRNISDSLTNNKDKINHKTVVKGIYHLKINIIW